MFTVESETRRGLLAAVLRATFLFLLHVGIDSRQVSSPLGLAAFLKCQVLESSPSIERSGRADLSNGCLAFQPRRHPCIPLLGNIGIEICHFSTKAELRDSKAELPLQSFEETEMRTRFTTFPYTPKFRIYETEQFVSYLLNYPRC